MRVAAAIVDVGLVLVFVVIGRRTHTNAVDAAGIASTAWPFVTALVAGWLATRAWRRPRAVLQVGVPVWIWTVALGMLLRAASGQGTAGSFMVVATVVLGAFLVGWRAIAAGVVRWSSARAGSTR